MGGGISTTRNEESSRYYCHSCLRQSTMSLNANVCPNCHSTFLELMNNDEIRNEDNDEDNYEIGNMLLSSLLRDRTEYLEEQSSRLSNASIMLRLLESSLREEFNTLNNELNRLNARNNIGIQPSKFSNILSQRMKQKLRYITVDKECSQMGCPICSEDYIEGHKELILPCQHLFHEECVMPWLKDKKTCPMCRFEITDSASTIKELECFSEEELQSKLTFLNSEDNVKYNTKHDLASVVHEYLLKFVDKEDNEEVANNNDNILLGNHVIIQNIIPIQNEIDSSVDEIDSSVDEID